MKDFKDYLEESSKDFEVILNPGSRKIGMRYAPVFIKVKLKNGNLSITGVEGPTKGGNARGSCGQILSSLKDIDKFEKGWNAQNLAKFTEYWKNWHLNDMVAGSPDQEKLVKEFTKSHRYDYEKIKEFLKSKDMHIDKNFKYNGKPYEYGTAWLKKEIPDEVIDFLKKLPNSKKMPAWI